MRRRPASRLRGRCSRSPAAARRRRGRRRSAAAPAGAGRDLRARRARAALPVLCPPPAAGDVGRATAWRSSTRTSTPIPAPTSSTSSSPTTTPPAARQPRRARRLVRPAAARPRRARAGPSTRWRACARWPRRRCSPARRPTRSRCAAPWSCAPAGPRAAGMLLQFDPRPPGGLHGGHYGLAWNEGGHGYLLSVHYATRARAPPPARRRGRGALRFARACARLGVELSSWRST